MPSVQRRRQCRPPTLTSVASPPCVAGAFDATSLWVSHVFCRGIVRVRQGGSRRKIPLGVALTSSSPSSTPSADVDVRRITVLRRRCFRCDVTLGVSRLLSGYCARPPGRKSAENPAAVEVKFVGFSDVRRAGRGKFEEREPTTAKRRAKIEDRESKFVGRNSKSEDRVRKSEDGS